MTVSREEVLRANLASLKWHVTENTVNKEVILDLIEDCQRLARSQGGSNSLSNAIAVIRAEPCPFKDGPMADAWAEAWATFLNRLGDEDGTNELYANSSPHSPHEKETNNECTNTDNSGAGNHIPPQSTAVVAPQAGQADVRQDGDPIAGAAYIVKTINFLREEEGDSVTILCDNPDFNGQPNCAIECNGQWTGWQDRRFTGETLIEALSAAYLQCVQLRAADDYGKKWSSDSLASQAPSEAGYQTYRSKNIGPQFELEAPSEASSGVEPVLGDTSWCGHSMKRSLCPVCNAEKVGANGLDDIAKSQIEALLASPPPSASSGVEDTKIVYVKRWRTLVRLPVKYAEEIVEALRSPPESTLPRELTAENGAKAALIGEFHEEFGYLDDGGNERHIKVPVTWTTIKAVWKAAVAHFDRTAALSREEGSAA